MKIAYAKLGRSIPLSMDEPSYVGGDAEVVNLMHRLGDQGHEIHVVGRNRLDFEAPWLVNHWAPGQVFHGCPGLPPVAIGRDVPEYVPFAEFIRKAVASLPEFDATVVWLGQNGSSLHPVPKINDKNEYTSPLVSLVAYGHPVVSVVNAQPREAILLCPDPRNTIKFRDFHKPLKESVLGQYNYVKRDSFYDEPNDTLTIGESRYHYAAIEMLALRDVRSATLGDFPPLPCGLLVNEGPHDVRNPRRVLVPEWMSYAPSDWEIFGVWSKDGERALGRQPYPVSVANVDTVMKRWRYTCAFPASGSGWATAKPWECFRAGCICFRHPAYDDQDHIYNRDKMGDELYEFLSPCSAAETHLRGKELESPVQWRHWATKQLAYLLDMWASNDGGMRQINDRLRQLR